MVGWHWIWKLKVPQKLKGFCWLLLQDRLLTNHQRRIRGLTTDDRCPRCTLATETLNHLFRECPKAKEFWHALRSINWLEECEHQSLEQWVQINLKCKAKEPYPIPWGMVFLYTLWAIWKHRNNIVFRQEAGNVQESIRYIQHQALENFEAFHTDHFTGQPLNIITNWVLLLAGKIKLNTAGSSKGNPGPAGYGGLFRDERGTWLHGYHGKLEMATSLEAELWAVYRGLTIMLEKGLKDICIETDSMQIVKFIQEASSQHSPHRAMIEDTKFLMRRCSCTITHISREGNTSADGLANLGVTHQDSFVFLNDPPTEIAALLVADIIGAGSSVNVWGTSALYSVFFGLLLAFL